MARWLIVAPGACGRSWAQEVIVRTGRIGEEGEWSLLPGPLIERTHDCWRRGNTEEGIREDGKVEESKTRWMRQPANSERE
eukprot:1494279-Rhodomonas_salina.2